MAIRDSWRRALLFSGLVDDSETGNPDYLARPEPPAPPIEPSAPPAGPPAWAPTSPEPAWAPTDHEPAENPTAGYHAADAGPIVVRRIGAPDDYASPAPAYGGAPEAGIDARVQPAPPAPPPSPSPWVAPDPPPPSPSPSPWVAAAPGPPPAPAPMRDVAVHRILPRSFNEAQTLADRFKAGTPVVLDLQGVETDLAKRLIGFASGLTYGLDGSMERLDGRVFLLVPIHVEVPAGQRARLAAQGSLNRV
jgi:hypothetical protein